VRAAVLVARWCGARRGEVRRLALDCLDRYPDGTPRLRLPAGKTYRERTVPLHEEAATALREVIARRAGGPERAFTDEVTGAPTRLWGRKTAIGDHEHLRGTIPGRCSIISCSWWRLFAQQSAVMPSSWSRTSCCASNSPS
jgi:integrase